MAEMRAYEFDLIPFGGDDVECVRVWAENRGRAFSAAVLAASDPLNTMRITLTKDEDRQLSGAQRDKIPEEHRAPVYPGGYELLRPLRKSGDGEFKELPLRAYHVVLEMFNEITITITSYARGRANAFFAALTGSMTPDSIQTVWLDAVETDEDEWMWLNAEQKYGGIMFDFLD